MNEHERLLTVIQRAKDILAEHFEVGIIMVQSHHENDETIRWEEPWGNALARDRHVELYYNECMEAADIEFIVDEDDDDDDDD